MKDNLNNLTTYGLPKISQKQIAVVVVPMMFKDVEGYGNEGNNGSFDICKGGESYGDKELTNIYLGSGGGGRDIHCGTNDGGAIIIESKNDIIINNNAPI